MTPVSIAMVLTITVASPGMPPGMVTRALTEAAAIWRNAGVQIEWRQNVPAAPSSLTVQFVDQSGHADERQIPIAWIDIVNGTPAHDIWVSRANGVSLLDRSNLFWKEVGVLPAAYDEIVGRALGRALAHEIGHYLFRSRAHDQSGLMATRRSSAELLGVDRRAFLLTKAERMRLSGIGSVVAGDPKPCRVPSAPQGAPEGAERNSVVERPA